MRNNTAAVSSPITATTVRDTATMRLRRVRLMTKETGSGQTGQKDVIEQGRCNEFGCAIWRAKRLSSTTNHTKAALAEPRLSLQRCLGTLSTALAVGTLSLVEIATVGLVRVTVLAAQDPDFSEGVIVALPVSALEEDLSIRIARADLNRCLSAFQHC